MDRLLKVTFLNIGAKSLDIGQWCYIFSSRVSLKVIKVLYRANFVSTRPVFHELYENIFSEKKSSFEIFFFRDFFFRKVREKLVL